MAVNYSFAVISSLIWRRNRHFFLFSKRPFGIENGRITVSNAHAAAAAVLWQFETFTAHSVSRNGALARAPNPPPFCNFIMSRPLSHDLSTIFGESKSKQTREGERPLLRLVLCQFHRSCDCSFREAKTTAETAGETRGGGEGKSGCVSESEYGEGGRRRS